MSARLLLCLAPPFDIQRPPLNLAYLAAYARHHGVPTRVWDLNIAVYNLVKDCELARLWGMSDADNASARSAQELLQQTVADDLDRLLQQQLASGERYIGFSIHYLNVQITEALVRRIRQLAPDRVIIYGGPQVTSAHAGGVLDLLSADAYVHGEGEQTLVEALRAHASLGRFEPLPGLIVPQQDGLSELTVRPPIRDLDSIPLPRWDDFPLTAYDHPGTPYPVLPLLTSRGCVGRCAFCLDHRLAGRFRHRSVANVLTELTRNWRRYKTRSYTLNDLLGNGNVGVLRQLCRAIIQHGLDLEWTAYAMVRREMDSDLFWLMRRAGCVMVCFGVESGSDAVLRLMNKRYTAAVAEQNLRLAHQAGIETQINILVGFPGETREMHEETLDFLRRNRESIEAVTNLSTCVLMAGAPIGVQPDRWGIRWDEQRTTWYADDGNTIEERSRRLQQLQRLLAQLEIPVKIVNREDSPAARQEVETAAPLAETRGPVSISSFQLLDPQGRSCLRFRRGSALRLRMRCLVHRPVAAPLVRVQIFTELGVTPGNNLFVIGTNTARGGDLGGRWRPGTAEVELTIAPLNLSAGNFRVTAGLWPDEGASRAYDVHHGVHPLVVQGCPDSSGARVHQPVRAVKRRGPPPPAARRFGPPRGAGAARPTDTPPCIVSVELLDGDGQPRQRFHCRNPMIARVHVRLQRPRQARVAAWILSGNVVLHRCDVLVRPDRAGEATLELHYDPLNLLAGDYQLCITLQKRNTGYMRLAHRTVLFQVGSSRHHGGGLVHCPASWSVRGPATEPA